jgi:conjugal transfer ATP-binding protein TraC
MFAFTSAGVYGRWFNGRNNVDMDNRMVVLELQQLTGRKDLQRVVLLQVMYQVQRAMDTLPREMKKLLLIDEAFSLLASNETKEFIVTFYRQLRKFGASCVVCTQSVMDFASSEGASAIVENSAHMLLLAQKAESISMVKKTGAMPMTDVGYKLLESVHTIPGEYSEIMIRNGEGVGVGRLVVSDFNKLLYSSKAQDVAAIKVWTDRGLNMADAINNVLLERTGRRDGDAGEEKAA